MPRVKSKDAYDILWTGLSLIYRGFQGPQGPTQEKKWKAESRSVAHFECRYLSSTLRHLSDLWLPLRPRHAAPHTKILISIWWLK